MTRIPAPVSRGMQVVVQGAVPAAPMARGAPLAMATAVPMAVAAPGGAPAYAQSAPIPAAAAIYNPTAGASTGGLYPAVPLATAVAYPAK